MTNNFSFSDELVERVKRDSSADLLSWLQYDHQDILERINRLCVIDESYRYDALAESIPPDELRKIPNDHRISIYRGCPAGAEIRPGDWVSWDKTYASQHSREKEVNIATLHSVQTSDIYWAGTDMQEFFYLPEAWRKNASSPIEYLSQLSSTQIRILADGEMQRISQNSKHIEQVKEHIYSLCCDKEWFSEDHGEDHWSRVALHANSLSRANGVDPLLGNLFAWVHDSQRENNNYDPEHGQRAATFIVENRSSLFAFLTDDQAGILAYACELHSDGYIHAPLDVQVCWDSDRLDLGRVNCVPNPNLLCTEYARRPEIIQQALDLSGYEYERSEEDSIELQWSR